MASGQLSDTDIDIGFYRPNGNWESCFTAVNNQITTAGSPDGVIPALKENENWHLNKVGAIATPGCRLNIRFKLNTSDGVDKSDCGVILPVSVQDTTTGAISTMILNKLSFGTATDLPAGSITGTWYDFGATGYLVQAGQNIRIGTSPAQLAFISIENDA